MPRYRFLVRGATVLVYGGRREVLAANEATASERSGDKHPGSREREGGHSGIQKIFNGHFVTSVSSLGRETEHLGPQREAAVYNNAHTNLCNNSNSLALSRGRAMPLAHSKLQQRVGGGRVLDIWYLPAPEAAGERRSRQLPRVPEHHAGVEVL